MFLRNRWYVAAFAADLGDKPLARTICGRAMVLFRAAGGQAVALEDRCVDTRNDVGTVHARRIVSELAAVEHPAP